MYTPPLTNNMRRKKNKFKIGNLKVYGVIYKITNKKSKANKGIGRVYIGQSITGFNKRYNAKGKGIERVYNFHKNKKDIGESYNRRLLEDIEKYGFDSFEVCEIFDVAFSKEELDIKEILWIKYYNSIKKGYNILEGGTIHKKNKILKRFNTYTPILDRLQITNNIFERLIKIYNNNFTEIDLFIKDFTINTKNGFINNILLRYKKKILKYFDTCKKIEEHYGREYDKKDEEEFLINFNDLLTFLKNLYNILKNKKNIEEIVVDIQECKNEYDLYDFIRFIQSIIEEEIDSLLFNY